MLLLVCTVGGAPEPVVASILASQPARVVFVCSSDSKRSLTSSSGVLDMLAASSHPYDSGRIEIVELPDPQDLARCVDAIHRNVTPEVERWLARGGSHTVIVDFTGGTKCMTLALGLMTRLWPCRLQYVGGTERTRDGLGVVVSGREQIVHFQDPWNALGYQLLDDVRVVFDSGGYGAAAALAAETRKRVSNGPLKGAVSALVHFLEGYAHWDRFDHAAARRSFGLFDTQRYMLTVLVSPARVEAMTAAVARAAAYLQSFAGPPAPSRRFVADLVGNARRRYSEGRYDDAVARLYRAIEAAGQWQLSESHGFPSTARIPLASVPEPLRTEWAPKAALGILKLGLQDTFTLLQALGNSMGNKFRQCGLAARTEDGPNASPLVARNNSYLAHGFQPATPEAVERLLDKTIELLSLDDSEIPAFPELSHLLKL